MNVRRIVRHASLFLALSLLLAMIPATGSAATPPGARGQILVKQRGAALVDQINVRRASSAPWFG